MVLVWDGGRAGGWRTWVWGRACGCAVEPLYSCCKVRTLLGLVREQRLRRWMSDKGVLHEERV